MSQTFETSSRSSDHPIEKSSNKSFGFVFTVVFLIIGLLPLRHREDPRWWAVAIALSFLMVTLIRADVLEPLNIRWMKLGLFLGKIMNPIFLGIVFFVVITPMAILLRIVGKDLLSMKLQSGAKSYWVPKTPSHEDGMKNQF